MKRLLAAVLGLLLSGAAFAQPGPPAGIIHPGYIVNFWYPPVGYTAPFAIASASGANVANCTFGAIPSRVTISNLGSRITTAAAAGNVQFAIYSNGAWGRPATLLAATPSISTTATGAVNGAAPISLAAGNYWFCQNADNGTVILGAQFAGGQGVPSPYIGSASAGSAGSGPAGPIVGISVAQTFGTWPAWTSGTVWTDLSASPNAAPYITFRVGSVP